MDEATIKIPIPKCHFYWCFCLGWCTNFVGSESGQKQSVKLHQNMVYNTTQHPPPPQPHTICLYCTFTLGSGGEVGEVREKADGQQFTRGVENTNQLECISTLQSINSLNTKTTLLGFCVFTVPSSMKVPTYLLSASPRPPQTSAIAAFSAHPASLSLARCLAPARCSPPVRCLPPARYLPQERCLLPAPS
jgi:hypothetical protein